MKLKDILNPKPILESSVKVGNMYMVHGYPLLKGLFPNKYYKVDSINGDDVTLKQVNQQGKEDNFTGAPVTHKLSSIEASVQSVGRGDLNGIELVESINESWTVKDGSVLSNGKLIGYYDFDRDSDSFWVDDVKKGKGQLSFDTKKEVEDYFKKNEKDAIKHLGKLRESTTPSDIIKDLDRAKNDLLKKVDILVAKKKKLYSNVDIESPMSADEKKLDKDIADLFSQINKLVLQKRKIKNESVTEDWSQKYKDSIDCNNPKGFSQRAHCQGKAKNESMIKLKDLIMESKFPVYHYTYTSAINSALEWAEKQGFEYDKEETAEKIGLGPKKPSEGKTNRFSISLTKGGKEQKKMLHIQVYNMGTFKRDNRDGSKIRSLHGGQTTYELNCYIG